MLKISFIGAGSLVFGFNLLTDILTFRSITKDVLICLEDINPNRVDLIYKLLKLYQEKFNKELNLDGVTFEKTTDQKKAIADAKYVICAIQVGGLDAYKQDVDIPFKYGVTQNVGDSLGPGGVFRFLRTAPHMKSIVEDINNSGYNSTQDYDKPMLLNYTNPMAMVSWLCNIFAPDSTIGLCHGVFHTARTLRHWIGAKREEFSYFCAGINHMAWFLDIWYKNSKDPNSKWQDAYPLVHKAFEDNPKELRKYMGVRYDMMKATGYFMTESDGHLSEYLPYYRKRQDLLDKYKTDLDWFSILEHASDYNTQIKFQGSFERKAKEWIEQDKLRIKEHPSGEYASFIINAIETNKPFRFNGNILNTNQGLITNLPDGCCVEVPIFADSQGIHPQGGIKLPTICQALCTSNIMVQKAAVEGYIEKDKEKIYHAVLLDPNTASVCSPAEIKDMVDEMFKAQSTWINYM